MHILENENVRVELSEDAAVLRLTDKKNGGLMESDSPTADFIRSTFRSTQGR